MYPGSRPACGEWRRQQAHEPLVDVDELALSRAQRTVARAVEPPPEMTAHDCAIESIRHSVFCRDPHGRPSSSNARRYHSPSQPCSSAACATSRARRLQRSA